MTRSQSGKEQVMEITGTDTEYRQDVLQEARKPQGFVHNLYIAACVFLLFLTFFIAQFDKFILSYFQEEVIKSLNLSSIDYGVLSGYATSIVFAIFALPTAFIADFTEGRVWVLTIAALWWSLCVLFQGLSHNFWEILLARIGMGIGQAPVEALSISLISDMVSPKWLFLCER
jgi:MFS family permease